MTIYALRNMYNAGYYNAPTPDSKMKRLQDDHVFDENQSVRWNRDKVAKWNDKVDKYLNSIKMEASKKQDDLHADAAKSLMEEFGFNQKQAEIIENHVYSDKHSCMNDYFYELKCIGELIHDVIGCK